MMVSYSEIDIDRQVKGMLVQSFIEPSTSPYGATVMLVNSQMAHGISVTL